MFVFKPNVLRAHYIHDITVYKIFRDLFSLFILERPRHLFECERILFKLRIENDVDYLSDLLHFKFFVYEIALLFAEGGDSSSHGNNLKRLRCCWLSVKIISTNNKKR